MRRPPPLAVRRHILHGCALGAAIAAVSVLQSWTDPSRFALQAIYGRAYYVPILLAGVWYGMAGGLVAAVVSVASSALHLHPALRGGSPELVNQYAELVVFLVLGGLVGAIADRARHLAAGCQDALRASGNANRELRALQDDLRRVDRVSALGSIAAGVAHEIRRPLVALKGALDSSAPARPDAASRDLTAVARRELSRLETLVNRLCAYAEPAEPRLQEVALSDVLTRVSERLARYAERANVTVELDARASLPTLFIDGQQIEQAIFNVALNAVQATGRGGRVVVRLLSGPRCQAVEVIDNGPGIAPEYRERLFEPFFTTKERGVGLGLPIARRLLDAHYGTIEVRARSPMGTVVRIELPEAGRAVQPMAPERIEVHQTA